MNNYLKFILFVIVLMPQFAFAQAGQGVLGGVVTDPVFKNIIDICLLFRAGYEVYSFVMNFNPSDVMKGILKVAAYIFFAFNWIWVLEITGLV